MNLIEIYYDVEFKNNENEDYAIIVLNRRIGDYTGYFRIKKFDRKSLKNRKTHIYENTAGVPGQIENESHFWGTERDFTMDPSNKMSNHIIATSLGLYIEENSEYYLIGVHVKGPDFRAKWSI